MKLTQNTISKIITSINKRVEPKPGFTQASVLMLFFNKKEQTHLVYIERTKGNTPHSGQIGFPGGKLEPGDDNSKTAAFRETHEEIGVTTDSYDYIGNIGFHETSVSMYDACVHIAWCKSPLSYKIDAFEVARIFEIPIGELYRQYNPTEDVSDAGPNLRLAFNVHAGNTALNIWGLTARMTHHFLTGLHLILKV